MAFILDLLVVALIVGVIDWLDISPTRILTGGMRDQRISPNHGIRPSGWHALLAGLGCSLPALATGLLFELGHAARLAYQINNGPVINAPAFSANLGLIIFLFTGIPAALRYGGATWLRHYTIRAALRLARATPWNYEAFLEAMTGRLLPRRIGSGYMFLHQMLRDYLIDSVMSGKFPVQDTADAGARRRQ